MTASADTRGSYSVDAEQYDLKSGYAYVEAQRTVVVLCDAPRIDAAPINAARDRYGALYKQINGQDMFANMQASLGDFERELKEKPESCVVELSRHQAGRIEGQVRSTHVMKVDLGVSFDLRFSLDVAPRAD